jgi:negative regulator of flagellin synthesis FlgM
MKINEQPPIMPPTLGPVGGPNGPAARRAIGSSGTDTGAAARAGAPAAKVELSTRSRELHEALRAANAAPDVREDVVADVKARLGNGTYQVNPDQIARGIVARPDVS